MDRTQKAEAVQSLNGLFTKAGAVVVAHYNGMTVAQMGELRSRLRKAGASFKVAKNRLAVRALEGTQAAGISDLFKGPTGIAYSNESPMPRRTTSSRSLAVSRSARCSIPKG